MPLRPLQSIIAGLAVYLLAPIDSWASDWWRPLGRVTWDWQLSEPYDFDKTVSMLDLDLFETGEDVVAALKSRGVYTVCYLSAGSWEAWRDDADQFPADTIGKAYEGWPGERWLDIRRIDVLAPLIGNRLDLCKAKGFDAVEPDNIDGYTNDTGFPLSAEDQIRFNRWLAAEAHRRGLSIGLKNDPDQAAALADDFDWALTEDCFAEGWCRQMQPFISRGKAVFAAEYTDTGITLEKFCTQAEALGVNAILKRRELDSWMRGCP